VATAISDSFRELKEPGPDELGDRSADAISLLAVGGDETARVVTVWNLGLAK
jgi:hypothetical protein